MYEVRPYRKLEKDIRDFHANVKNRIRELLLELQYEPLPREKYDLKKVEGREETYRIRISYARVVYEIQWEDKIVKILLVERKTDETYKKI